MKNFNFQQHSLLSLETCAACDFNHPSSQCQLPAEWTWRGDYVPATGAEVCLRLLNFEF